MVVVCIVLDVSVLYVLVFDVQNTLGLSDAVQNLIRDILADGVVTSGVIVSGVFLPSDTYIHTYAGIQ
jgi:hypothetical protein